MKTVTKLWIGLAVLALLAPLGLIVPALFGAGGAWGEWSTEELQDLIGYVPAGMKKIARLWSSPLPDYTVPGQGKGLAGDSLGYVLTAFIGIAVSAGLAYLLARWAGRK
jgi:hypothetical protein